MFEIEDVVKYLVLPSSAVTIGLIACFILVCIRPVRRWGFIVGVISLAIYAFFGAGPISFLLLGSLEYQIPPAPISEPKENYPIAVLTGYAESDPDRPLSSQVNSASAFRLLEAMKLLQVSPSSTVIISGTGEVARIMRDVLVSSGIPVEQIRVDSDSVSTYESARHLAHLLGGKPFLLVTSAGHMPRAMGVFRKAGMAPLPMPTHYLTRRNSLATQYFPSPTHLELSDLAISEYAALAWYYVNGWI
jgi:uncharacterized SAM-binding protein YcdF (DUF218 family)